jgi:hypothetical protein
LNRGPFVPLLALACALGACTPALDWRESSPQGSQARLMFPCRPAGHARQVVLAGEKVEMTLFACTAVETVFALSFVDVKDSALVGPALGELANAARSHLRGGDHAASQPLDVPGMTPHPLAAQWRLSGTLANGRAMQERVALFSRGTVVYQATMLGTRLEGEAQETFFGSLRVGVP